MECKVDMAISVTYLSRTPIFEWYVFRCGSKNVYKLNRIFLVLKKHLFKTNWITCSKYDYHSRYSSQPYWGNLYGHLMRVRIFTLIMNMIFIHLSSITNEENGCSLNLNLLIVCFVPGGCSVLNMYEST